MKLPQTAEYALRAMVAVSLVEEDCPCRTKDISAAAGIPSHYLSKIMRRLVEAGLLASQKGHGGGFVLARPKTEIRFLDILRAVDYEVEQNVCAFGWNKCDPDHPCPLHPIWSKLKVGFLNWAESNTLADVSKQ
jgi:Rrf2 family iron-sulfur cluster assembly transcriptional regulator